MDEAQMDSNKLVEFINHQWDNSIVPTLMEYIKIPNKSPQFDAQWQEHGYMDKAVELIADWCRKHAAKEMKLDVVRLPGRTPVILMDIPGDKPGTVLLYGHLDKQPEMTGWDDGLSPWSPTLRGDKLYGRGAADDGYAAFASLTAVTALQAVQISHPRCVILIEACEESGSFDLPFYIDALQDRIGKPDLVICLDSGCGNYEQLWTTTSLRGLLTASVTIDVLKQGVHSGAGSGIVPSCFQVLRQLLSRIEDEKTGDVILKELFVDIPRERIDQAKHAADVLGDSVFADLPFHDKVIPRHTDGAELLLNRTWRPALSVIGMNGMPMIENAGNVTLPTLTVKLSMRLPPTCDATKAGAALKAVIEKNPPYGAHVRCDIPESASGWNAPASAPWLIDAANQASLSYFGKPAVSFGEGGSIPFMGMLGKKFPQAQFLITGVLGPGANAHGPNEFLHIPTGKKLTACVAEVVSMM